MKYLFPLILGCIAAVLTGEILSLSGSQATFDAWILTLTIVGHDV